MLSLRDFIDGMELVWLRAWDAATGQMLPSLEERIASHHARAEAERARADAILGSVERLREQTERADKAEEAMQKLLAKLRDRGVDPDRA